MTAQLVVGAGEVGKALAEVLGIDVLDVHTAEEDSREVEILHIAFPWSEPSEAEKVTWDHGPVLEVRQDGFVNEVRRYADIHQATIVVVHSTVPVETCDPEGWIHSPIRGRHPHLAEGIRTFEKPVAGYNDIDVALVRSVFASAGIETVAYPNARTSELGKLLELAQYGVEIRMQKEAYALARLHDVDPELAYYDMGLRYNRGWAQLYSPRFVKPVLAEVPGPIGGHCVAQNTPLLENDFFNEAVLPLAPENWDSSEEAQGLV